MSHTKCVHKNTLFRQGNKRDCYPLRVCLQGSPQPGGQKVWQKNKKKGKKAKPQKQPPKKKPVKQQPKKKTSQEEKEVRFCYYYSVSFSLVSLTAFIWRVTQHCCCCIEALQGDPNNGCKGDMSFTRLKSSAQLCCKAV